MSEVAKFHWAEGMKYVAEGIKSFFLLNGAATISTLTFLGNTRNGDDRLVYAMEFFAFGALMGPIAYLFAYLTQLNYGNASDAWAWRYHRATYWVVTIGILLFVLGVSFAACGLMDALPSATPS